MRHIAALLLSSILCGGCNEGGLATGEGDLAAGDGASRGAPDLAFSVILDLAPAPPQDLTLVVPQALLLGNYILDGITDDGFVAYHDTGNTKAFVANVATGNAQAVGDIADAEGVSVAHTAVFVAAPAPNTEPPIGALSVWTAAAGSHLLSSAAGEGRWIADAAADGSAIAYLTEIDSNTEALMLDKPDHSRPTNPASFPSRCATKPSFVGARVVVNHCAMQGATSGTLTSYDPATGAGVDLVASAVFDPGIAVDAVHPRVLVGTSNGQGIVSSVDGSDTHSIASGFGFGLFFPDGNSIVYRTTSQSLMRVPVAGGNPTQLLATGVIGLGGPSGDGRWALYVSTLSDSGIDLHLASIDVPGPGRVLEPQTTVTESGFSDDSNWAIYLTVSIGNTAILQAAPVAGGETRPLALESGGWLGAGGDRVLFIDNFSNDPSPWGSGDLYMVALSSADPPRLLAKGVGARFFLTPERTAVVYSQLGGSFDGGVGVDGIYVQPLP